jgi:IS1 family transposase
MNLLSTDARVRVLLALVEGNSIRATVRQTGVAKGTILALLRDVGAHCKNYHDRFVRGVNAKRVQADEIWSFVGAKDRNIAPADKGHGRGDVWTFTAMDADSKLMIAYRLGTRDARVAMPFMLDLADRLAGRVQLTTDGHQMYALAVENAFGWNGCDYAQLVKIFGPSPESERRYSPSVIVRAEKEWVMGQPDMDRVSTSYVERQNLTMRMQMRRFTRLTNAFSKKLENHRYAVALHFMHYNFCRAHATLTKERGVRTTPAMAAGLATEIWPVERILELLRGD